MSAQGEVGQVAGFQAMSHQNVGDNVIYSADYPCSDQNCSICHIEALQSETGIGDVLRQNNGAISESERRRLANLKPWQPGQSGNPGGRPKKRPISDLYDEILSDPENVKLFKASVIKAVASGRMASMFQLKEMADRVEGKVTQPVEMSGEVTLAVSDRVSRARERAKLVENSDSGPNVTK